MWYNAHIGVGLYIYNTKHVRSLKTYERILFSTFGAVVFNYSAALLWASVATAKNFLPKCDFVRSTFGVVSGAVLLFVGREYLKSVDNAITKNEVATAEE